MEIRSINNANVYVDGINWIGKVQEAEMPMVKAKMVDHVILGSKFDFELPKGFEKMESSFTWNATSRDIIAKVGKMTTMTNLQLRFSLETWGQATGLEEEEPGILYLSGMFKELPTGGFKRADNAEFKSTFNVLYLKLEISAQTLVEIDVVNNSYKIEGQEQLLTYKLNTGA